MVTKICVGNYVSDIYNRAKFYPNRFRVDQFCACVISRPSAQSDSAIFGVLEKGYSETRAPILTQNTSNDAVPRKEVPFGVAKPKSKVSTPIFPRKHFWAPFRRDLKNFFARKRL